MSSNTQLTHCADLEVGNIIFSKPETKSIPNTPISYKRINILYKNGDGSVGDLIIPTEQLFSFGVQENTDMASNKITGYSIPLCLWNRTGATEAEENFISTFESIVDTCHSHLLEDTTKHAIEKYDLDESDLKKFNPVYRKRDKGKIVEGKSPCLYPKLIVSKKDGDITINSFFVDGNGDDLDPMNLIGKRMNCTCSLKVESIFVGRTISLQVKVYECVAEMLDGGMKRLLSVKPKSKSVEEVMEQLTLDDNDNEEETDNGSIKDESDPEPEEEPEPEPEPPKKKGGRKKKGGK
tara:strand:- start:224 stop:1105 length:882 start_codon:yes stop_codon:yes gene_type:complete